MVNPPPAKKSYLLALLARLLKSQLRLRTDLALGVLPSSTLILVQRTARSTRKSGSSNTPVANLKLAAPDFGDQTSLGQSVLPESDEERQVEDRSSEQGEEGDGEESSSGSESGSGSECEESMDTRSSLIPKKKSMQNLSKTELEGKVARLKAEIARREASCEPVRGTTAPVILSMSSSKRGPKVTVKIEEGVSSIVEEEEGTRLQKEALGRIVGRHVREVVLGMCSITHANSVNIELLHDEDGAPVYWDATNSSAHTTTGRLMKTSRHGARTSMTL
ncbi:hypothetical protein RhiLY_03592 [Ceratobasidium sp. AG-Ba]|nr:hypothetical protein RhiLY_03592 [Ceratobasidium sp. AG-Ba]